MSDDEVEMPAERSLEELEERHDREMKELEAKMQQHVEATKQSAGKGKKAKEKVEAATREAENWQYNLRMRQQAEADMLEDHLASSGTGKDSATGAGAAEAEVAKAPPADEPEVKAEAVEDTEEEKARRKKDKAQRKRQNKADKQAAAEAEKEREKREAGPSGREIELKALSRHLLARKPPMRVQEVAADGNCLYRSVVDQLRRARPDLHAWARAPECHHDEVRSICAKALRSRQDSLGPFAELKEGEDFNGYCDRVEHSADWGGELELRALADELRVRIFVHRAEDANPLVLGEEKDGGAPLQVAFHRHYYALGEHYNSVVPFNE